jgi:hypothetical protein
MNLNSTEAWIGLLNQFVPWFTAPTFPLFIQLAGAWVLCPGRHTLTRLYLLAEPKQARSHDAYHRFFGRGAWLLAGLWRQLASLLLEWFNPQGPVWVDLDDTLFHKSGRQVDGAAWWRDAVRSTSAKVVHGLGLNLVVLTLRVVAPWGGEPLGLPINVRLHRKHGPTTLDLAEEMMRELASWFPQRAWRLAADGAYASLAKRDLPRCEITSRMRRDAALFELPPQSSRRRRGRPRKKGRRLPTPLQMAKTKSGWKRLTLTLRGKSVSRLVYARQVLWYELCPHHAVLLVICRDPQGEEPDDFYFTTDLSTTPAEVIEQYGGRWSIEDTFRNVKQYLGGQDPQVWKGRGPERAAAFAFWMYALIWAWYLRVNPKQPTLVIWPWYRQKANPSFADALAALRRCLWSKRIFEDSGSNPLPSKIMRLVVQPMIEALAYAA